MYTITGVNGAEIKIDVAPFKDAIALKNVVFGSLAETGIDISSLDLKTLNLKTEIDQNVIDTIMKPLLKVDSSPEFYFAIFKCMNRCLYNGSKITEETFEPIEARGDYYLILLEVLKANLLPFIKELVSAIFQAKKSLNQKVSTQK